ncbi:sigma-70 family RNA polymerase sigma factor [Limnoglobus roseus]|uniref:Sigma-70 family RNA polymerase sigma factor n=1 Tax=Limnoglobus roseus TaxID=2598579 RepID=A0A5C1AR01_9BACT|nr:sigma-70 family RNA polymerase sigma factor [Limnoglobus roseus]QEL20637.1 sigma-70 family RNA polymerase sigma factor [Limnoglobus roseus]
MSAHPLTESAIARRLVRDLACRLVARRRHRGWDADDIAQELFLRLLTARRAFDPARGRVEALVAVVVERAVIDLLRRQAASKRTGRMQSLHAVSDADRGHSYNPVPAVDRALDVAAVLVRLPGDLRAVAELLKSESFTAAARTRAVSRGTLRRQVRDLRRAFERYKARDS